MLTSWLWFKEMRFSRKKIVTDPQWQEIETVDNYILSLERQSQTSRKSSEKSVEEVQANPKVPRINRSLVSWTLWLKAIIDDHLGALPEWYVGLDELRYYVQHYRKGARSLIWWPAHQSQRYKDYKAEAAWCPQPLSYKKHIKEAYTKLIERSLNRWVGR